MTRYVARLGAVGLALGLTTSPLAAQLAANPVYLSPKGPNGLTLAFDFGTTVSTDATTKPNHVGGRAVLGLPIVKLGVAAGMWNSGFSGAPKELQFGANAAISLFSPPVVPVGINMQVGAGYLKIGSGATAVKVMNVPLAIGVGVKPPTPGVSFEAWGAPRVQITRTDAGALGSNTDTGVGASAGVNLGMPMGLGLHAALDVLSMNSSTEVVVGVGLHYTFTIPGIPMVPMI